MRQPLIWIVLFLSLALNVFGLGAYVGARVTAGPGQTPEAAREARIQRNPVNAAVRQLSPDAQAAWRAQMPSYAANFAPKMREARLIARQTMHGFSADPLDEARARAGLARARTLELEGRTEMDRRLVAFAATLSAEDRKVFAEALANPLPRNRPDKRQR